MGKLTGIDISRHIHYEHTGYAWIRWSLEPVAEFNLHIDVIADRVDAWVSDARVPASATITIAYVDAGGNAKGCWAVSKAEINALIADADEAGMDVVDVEDLITSVSTMWADAEDQP